MSELLESLERVNSRAEVVKSAVVGDVERFIKVSGYNVVELNSEKPWGAYFRIDGSQADAFVEEFFPDLSPVEARLGNQDAELSPKILLVAPGERLSWQYHDRRAERWTFITPGAYKKSTTDEEGDMHYAKPGDVVQFKKGERHRLIGIDDQYVIVAEIWQHTDSNHPSDEDDIVRLQDDYRR